MTREGKAFMDATTLYLTNLEADHASPQTISNYAERLESFRAHLEETGGGVSVLSVLSWKKSLAERGMKTSSIAQYLKELSAFFHWAAGVGLYQENPVRDHIRPEVRQQPYDNLLTEQEFLLLLAEERPKGVLNKYWTRNRAIAVLFITTAIRNAELRALTPADLDFEHGVMKVRSGKGGKYRVVSFPGVAQVAVRKYLADGLRHADAPPTAPLFGSTGRYQEQTQWHGLERVGLTQMIGRHVARVTGHEHVGTHALRHASASVLVSSGMSMKEIQALLGHSSIQTTEIYAQLLQPNLAPAKSANRIFAEMDYLAKKESCNWRFPLIQPAY